MSMLTATRCKHFCCREGVDKAPKAPKASLGPKDGNKVSQTSLTKPGLSTSDKASTKGAAEQIDQSEVEVVDLSSGKDKRGHSDAGSGSFQNLQKQKLHSKIVDKPSGLLSSFKKPTASSVRGKQKTFSFLGNIDTGSSSIDKTSRDYDADWLYDLPSPSVLRNRSEPEPSEAGFMDDITIRPEDDATGMDTEAHSLEDSPPSTAQKQPMTEDLFALSKDDMFGDCELEFENQISEGLGQPSVNLLEMATQPASEGRSTQPISSQGTTMFPPHSPEVFHGRRPSTGQNTRADSRGASPSPSRKRQRVEDGHIAIRVDVASTPADNAPRQVNDCKLRPWDDMTGIDMEFLAEIAEIVEFV